MKYLLCALGLFVLTSTALAEEVTRKAGDKSINFSLSGEDLQAYKYGFGGKYWISSDIAFSASIDISNNKNETSDSAGGTSHSTYDSSYYALSLAIERHLQTSSRLSPYFGGELRYAHSDSESTNEFTPSIYRSNMSEKDYGAGVLVGAEYAFNKAVSLAGEYVYGFNYSTRKFESDFSDQTGRSKGFNLSVGRLTLLLYF